MIPNFARDAAPFIYWGKRVLLLDAAGLSEIPDADTRDIVLDRGRTGIKIHSNIRSPIRCGIL